MGMSSTHLYLDLNYDDNYTYGLNADAESSIPTGVRGFTSPTISENSSPVEAVSYRTNKGINNGRHLVN